MVNSTKCGGAAPAWVANRIFGCLPPRTGGGVAATRPAQPGIQPAGRHPGLPARQRQLDSGHQPVQVPPGGGRDVHPGRPARCVQLPVELAVEELAPVLVHQIPLVAGQHQRPACLDDHADDPQVLLGERLAGVDQDDRDLGPVQRARGPQRRIVVGALALPEPAPDAGRVHEPPGLAAQLDQLVHRVAGGARHLVHQGPRLPGELVEQAGLAHVGPADQGDPPGPVVAAETAPAGRPAVRRAPRRADPRCPGRAARSPGTAHPGRATTARPRPARPARRPPCWRPAPPACRCGAARRRPPRPRRSRRPRRPPRTAPRSPLPRPAWPARRPGRPAPRSSPSRDPSRRCPPG